MGAEKIAKQSGFATEYTDRMIARFDLRSVYRVSGLMLPGGNAIFDETPTLDEMIAAAKKAAASVTGDDKQDDEPAGEAVETDEGVEAVKADADFDERLVQVFSLSDLAEAGVRAKRATK